jgi:hypothetical protein
MNCRNKLAGVCENFSFVGFPTLPIQTGKDPLKASCKNTPLLE